MHTHKLPYMEQREFLEIGKQLVLSNPEVIRSPRPYFLESQHGNLSFGLLMWSFAHLAWFSRSIISDSLRYMDCRTTGFPVHHQLLKERERERERGREVTQSSLTLCDPMDCSLPGSSVHGIFQARILEWVAISYLGDLPDH